MKNDTFIISKAGYRYLSIAVAFFIIFSLFGWGFFKFLTFLAFIFFVYVYRNEEREIPYFQNDSLISPVDGKVTAIYTLDDGYEVVIKSSLFDTSILRAPLISKVKSFRVRKGARLSTEIRKSILLNEKLDIEFEDNNKNIVHIEHILDNSIDDITVNIHSEQYVYQGKRYGVMTKGITTIRLPLTSRLSIHVDDKLRAGETLIGYIS